MSSRRRVEVELTLKDSITKGLGGIKSNLNSLTAGIGAGISSAITSRILDGVSGAIGKIGEQFKTALNMETGNIMGGNALLQTGAFNQLDKAIEGYSDLTKTLAKEASELPGSTQDYLTIMGTTIGTYSAALGKTGTALQDELKVFAKDLVPKLSMLMQSDPTLQNRDVSLFMKGLLGNKSWNELEKEEMLLKNDILKRNMKALRSTGKYSDDASGRVKLFKDAINKTLSPEVIERMKNTFSGAIESFKDKVFGLEGIFDFAKDTMPNVEGVQSVFLQLRRIFDRIFGDNGFLTKLARIFGLTDNSFGQAVFNGAEKVITWLNKLNRKFESLASVFGDDPDTKEEKEAMRNIHDKLLNITVDLLDALIVKPLNKLGSNPQGMWDTLSKISEALKGVFWGVVISLENISWKGWLMGGLIAVGVGLVGLVGAGLLAAFASIPSLLVVGAGLALVGLLEMFKVAPGEWEKINWFELGEDLFEKTAKFIGAIGLWLIQNIPALFKIGDSITAIFRGFVLKGVQMLGKAIGDMFIWLGDAIRNFPNTMYDKVFGKEDEKESASAKQATTAPVANNSNKVSNNTTNIGDITIKVDKTDAQPKDIVSKLNAYLNEFTMRTA